MADDNPTGPSSSDFTTPSKEDAQVEAAVLTRVLIEHPDNLSVPELCRVLSYDPDDFISKDAVERAVRELVGAGLVHHNSLLVVPTRAALYRERLEMD